MSVTQLNVRVPEEARDLMHRLTARLRSDVTFAARVEELLGSAAPVAVVSSGMDVIIKEIDVRVREAMGELPAPGPAVESLRDQIKALSDRVFALETRNLAQDVGLTVPAAAPQQMDLEDAIKAKKPASKPAAKAASDGKRARKPKPPATPEQKAERKAFGNEIRSAPGAEGLGWKALGEKLAPLVGITPASACNILSGSITSSPAVRNKMRAAVGLPTKG